MLSVRSHGVEEFKSGPASQSSVGGRVSNGLGGPILHHQVWLGTLSRPRVKHSSDRGMFHNREGLSFRLKASGNSVVVGSAPNQLQGDVAFHGSGLLGKPDLSHTTFAELFQQPLRTDQSSRGFLVCS